MKENEIDTFHIGVKALIFDKTGKILLLKRDHPLKKIYWDLPGGRLQKNETLLDALKREVQEETGLQGIENFYPVTMFLTNIRIPHKKSDVGLIFSVYKCVLVEPFEPTLSAEHIDFGWFSVPEVLEKLKMHYPAEFLSQFNFFSCSAN